MIDKYSKLENCNMRSDLIKKAYNYIDSFSTGHFNYIAKQVVVEVIDNTKNLNTLPYEHMSGQIEEATDFLIDLRDDAINRYGIFMGRRNHGSQDRYSALYDDRDWADANDYWHVYHYNSTAINIGDIERMIFRYLNVTWSSETLEWLMINAFLKQDIYNNAQYFIKNHIAFSQRLSLEIAKKSKLVYEVCNGFLYHMRLDWLLYLLVFITVFRYGLIKIENNHLFSGIISLALISFISLNSLLNLPGRIIRRKQFDKQIQKQIDLKQFTSHLTWSPSTLKSKIETINMTETFYPSFIPLLDKMIKRNPDVFNVKGGNEFYAFSHITPEEQ